MLKIANVTEDSRFGGPQRWILTVSGKLKNFGLDQIIIFPIGGSDRFYKELNAQGVKIKQISLHRLTKEKKHLINFVFLFIPEIVSLYRLFKKESVDIVHCNHSWQFKALIAGRLAGKKVIWHLHETSTPFFINIILKFLARCFADAFIVAGERVRNYYLSDQKLSGKPIIQIQAPVDTSLFDPEKIKKDQRITDYPGLKIVTVGNINPLKGLEYFIEMTSILNRRYDNLSFFAVGPHFDSQKVYSNKILGLAKQYGSKNLHFYGSSENIPSVLKAADVYVCSSIAEASPISVWEAMSMEKAVVSTDVGDVANFIKDGESGYIVPIKNASEMAGKVELLLEDAALRKKIGMNARKIAVKNLDVNICVEKHAKFYREVMAKH